MRSILAFLFAICSQLVVSQAHVIVLGTAQDGGFPHIGCQNECQLTFKNPELRRNVVALALVDPASKKWWLFEATPDMDEQLQFFSELTDREYNYLPEGIFITHAHIGHYTGLISLGREALGSKALKVHVLPKLGRFLQENGPWSQLVNLKNIEIVETSDTQAIQLTPTLSVTAFAVPHRDEFSETAGFRIEADKKYLFIPDIDKWSKWDKSIVNEVKAVDFAFIDGSFFADGELPNRSISEVPHPFVTETMELFSSESKRTKSKVHFIHFNHTNPLLFEENKRKEVLEKGFNIAEQGQKYD